MSSTLPPVPPTLDQSRFIDPVPSHFLCCVCWEVPLDPVVHAVQKNCDVVLCQRCKNEVSSRHGSCPQCRKGTMHEFSPMHRLLRVHYFEKMKIRCGRREYCKAVMNIESFKTHDQTCIGLQLECPVCQVILPRFKMAKHVLKAGLQHVHFFTESHFARACGTVPKIVGIKRPNTEITNSTENNNDDSSNESSSESENSSDSESEDNN